MYLSLMIWLCEDAARQPFSFPICRHFPEPAQLLERPAADFCQKLVAKVCLPQVTNRGARSNLFSAEQSIATPVLKPIMAPICDQLCTDSRHACIQTIDLTVLRSTTSIHLESDLSFTLLSFPSCTSVPCLLCTIQRKNELNRVGALSYVPDRPVFPKIPWTW